MKKLILLALLSLSLIGTAQQKINSYPIRTTVNDSDLFNMVAHDSTVFRLIRGIDLHKYMRSGSAVKDTTPSTGNTIVITTNYDAVLIHGSGTFMALTVNLPYMPVNGQIFAISSDQTVTSLTIANGTTVTNYTTLAIGTPIRLRYDAELTKWFNN